MNTNSHWALITLVTALFAGGMSVEAMAQEHDREHGGEHGEARPGPGRAEAPHAALHEQPERWREPDGHGRVLDNRYNHGHYYPEFGSFHTALPADYHPYYRGGSRYFFSGGIWYAPRGAGFIVVRPPAGLIISVLPPYYSTVWIGGIPYYYADDVYYTAEPGQSGYMVVDPPANADQPQEQPPGNSYDDLIIYPKNGQSGAQQAADRYECHNWAKGQSGFDPTQPGGQGFGRCGSRAQQLHRACRPACRRGVMK